ncbi:YaiO family outer membrane beta-barrel protein [Salinimicrobium sp. GXAS 041]|uniref:YaiO family outer membrane beta-barrel protein n=1 Tax=Salinimicrobium sp. GXAS 041 TaxID=3400806 RepID=UPI003C74EE80
MKKLLFSIILLISFSGALISQEITETNTDEIYKIGLRAYQNQDFTRSLQLTNRGLQLAPEYHDIRILRVRNLWALERFEAADEDLDFLLKEAPKYVDVLPLVHQRISRFSKHENALVFLNRIQKIYPEDISLQVNRAQLLLKAHRRAEARELAQELIKNSNLSGEDRYALQIVLNRTISNEIGVNYSYINFSEAYRNYSNWHTLSVEYQHNFNRTAVIGRVNHADREFNSGNLYELEAYPVFNDRSYAFINLGFSNGEMFPEFRGSASFFYNFAKFFEGELGGRFIALEEQSYFSGIIGLTAYRGKFYLNARTFVGPKRLDQVIQNYQFNLRYYFGNADNYLLARVGSGISPDERTDYTQVQYPGLEAYYLYAGINKTLGLNHIFQVSAGYLTEELTGTIKGNQLLANLGYRYRF